jgi:hypothetical protein
VAEVFKAATGTELSEAEKGWKDYVLGLKAPPSPSWVFLGVSGKDAASSGLVDDDALWSLDGVEVFDVPQFDELLKKRPKDRPLKIVVVRRTKAPAPVDYTEAFVTVDLPADKDVALELKTYLKRESGLRD